MRSFGKAACSAALLLQLTACSHEIITETDPPGGGTPPPGPPDRGATVLPASQPECDGSPGAASADFTVGSFEASYYSEDDGVNPGIGTDGSDATITPSLHDTETVLLPAIRYPWSDLHGIDSYGFYGSWEGSIEVHAPSATIDAAFDLSWSNASLSVDGQLIDAWANDSKTIPLQLSQGIHAIHVEHHNHWHTTGFNASFTQRPKVPLANGPSTVASLLDANTKIAYVGGYESAGLYNEVEVLLDASAAPVLLILHSYHAINWRIGASSCIAGVVLNAHAPGSTVTGTGDRPVVEIVGHAPGEGTAPATALAGQAPDHAVYEYALPSVVVPDLD